jgi:hypothetical protein
LALLLVTRPAGSADAVPACAPVELFSDDFGHFPPGWLSRPVGSLNGAIQEYHYLPHRGVPLGPWANAICYLDAWVAGDEDGAPYLEQHLVNNLPQLMSPLFVTGDPEWGDYTVEAKVRPLALDDFTGLAFRYATNRHYYLFALTGGKEVRLAVRLPLEKTLRVAEWRELGKAPFAYDTTRYHHLKVVNDGPRIQAFVDGQLLLEASDGERLTGKAGLVANVPARYQSFKVSLCPQARAAVDDRIAKREVELARLRAANPRPRLWKKFATPGFGAGRNVRFGDLDGDGALDMLIAQNVPRVQGDAFDHISALTAVTLDGRVLWQSGRPDPRNGLLTNDTPFQIHDLEGDGGREAVLVRDFKLQVLDGRTGAVKRWVSMPSMPPDAKPRPYELGSGDSIAFASLTARVDGHFRRVVTFPDDGHPDLTAAVIDLTGDPRDEVVLWDQERVWIYTQDGPPPSGRVYAPIRNPHYNDSNYRANVSLPRWAGEKPAAATGTVGRAVLALGQGLSEPFGVSFDSAGNLYIVEMGGNRVSVLGRDGKASVLAGTGEKAIACDEGPAATARFNGPHHLLTGPDGHLYVADTFNNCVRRIDLKTRVVTRVAGTGEKGFGGDGGPAREARFGGIYAIAFRGNVLFACDLDNRRIRAIDLKTGVVTTVAGNGDKGVPRDGEDARSQPLVDPRAIAPRLQGQPVHLRARRPRAPGRRPGREDPHRGGHRRGRLLGRRGPALAARLRGPKHISVDGRDDVLISDTENHVIRRYSPRDGTIRRVAGTGEKGAAGLGGPPEACQLDRPHGAVVQPGTGVLYVSDSENHRVIRIER